MKVAIYTLGCKVNQSESQALEQLLTHRGHTLTPFDGPADAYIVNTCTVTAVSDKKSRQIIRQARRRAPEAVVAVCGCYPQAHGGDAALPEVDLVCGTGDRAGFVALLEQTWKSRQKTVCLDDAFRRTGFEALPAGGAEGRTRALLKVEDGCVNFCSYCIIPYARGSVRSLPPNRAVEETKALAAAGYREIVVTGIEISSWGRDLPGELTLIDLVEALCWAAPGLRVRLGSLEPNTVTPEFCRRAAGLENLCPHFHLSLQSGCDTVLARMNRKYDTNRFAQALVWLREAFSDPAVTTDLIVGFPGETEEEFQATLDFLRECRFSAMHVFPYSKRPGTPAAGRRDQIPNAAKQDRARRAGELARAMEADYLRRQEGKTVRVLFEEEKDGLWQGHGEGYFLVRVPCGEDLRNQVRAVRLEKAEAAGILGTLTPETIE